MRDKSHDPPAPFEDAGAARAIEASLAGERGRGYGDMLRSVADWHWETDGELQLTQVSPGLTAALGTPGQILLGHSIFDLIDPQQRDAQAIRDAVDQQRAFRIDGLRLQGPNAGRTTWRITGIPYYATASGQFAGYRGTGTSSEGALERPVGTSAQLLKILEAALARKDELEFRLAETGESALEARLAAIAHELRTPLNAIIGFAEAMKEGHLERNVDYARNIHESGQHLLAVIEGLMQAEEPAAGREPELDVAAVAASALRMLETKAETEGISVINALPDYLPKAQGEGHILRQILLNLLTNAIKYTPRGGSIGIEASLEAPDSLVVMIWDTGIGIAPEHQERVFQRAYRAPQQTEESRPGSGLGLAIARNLAQGMGGDLEMDSTPRKGTRVSLRLLLAKEG